MAEEEKKVSKSKTASTLIMSGLLIGLGVGVGVGFLLTVFVKD
ncbi:MAG: hypothetical protein WC970_03665 [Dehalococcoidales bacterium]